MPSEHVILIASEHTTAAAQEDSKMSRSEPSVTAAHALLTAVFDAYTPRTELPNPKWRR
jgi:hypothetical protein